MSGMITKLKTVPPPTPPQPLENNPILQFFEVGPESSTAGPGLIWRVHDAYRKSDGKVSAQIKNFTGDQHYFSKEILLSISLTDNDGRSVQACSKDTISLKLWRETG